MNSVSSVCSVPGLVVEADDDGGLGEAGLVGGVRRAAPVATKVGQGPEKEIPEIIFGKRILIFQLGHMHSVFY